MRVTATVNYNDISATFSATMVKDDYDVPGSPTWRSPEDIELEQVEILGVCFLGKKELATLPDRLVDQIYDVMLESLGEW